MASGSLRLQKWVPDFDPAKAKSMIARIWIRIHDLRYEFWDTDIIMGIAHAIENPIGVDDHTLSGSVGMYARVLVDIDLLNPLPDKLMTESSGTSGYVSFIYERIPDFCRHCSVIGHLTGNYMRGNKGVRDPSPTRSYGKKTANVDKASMGKVLKDVGGTSGNMQSGRVSNVDNMSMEKVSKDIVGSSDSMQSGRESNMVDKGYVDMTLPLKDNSSQAIICFTKKDNSNENRFSVLESMDQQPIGPPKGILKNPNKNKKTEEVLANLHHNLANMGVKETGRVVIV